jgi:hypothetical protein
MIMSRHAEDDFEAFRVAKAMDSVGADVFSIVYNGSAKYPTAIDPHSRYIVFAKVKNETHIATVDNAIDNEMEK